MVPMIYSVGVLNDRSIYNTPYIYILHTILSVHISNTSIDNTPYILYYLISVYIMYIPYRPYIYTCILPSYIHITLLRKTIGMSIFTMIKLYH